MKSQMELSITQLNSTVVESMQPIILNVDNFVTFSAEYNDVDILKLLLDTFSNKLDNYASMLYYAPAKKLSQGGKFINNLDWVPPKDLSLQNEYGFRKL